MSRSLLLAAPSVPRPSLAPAARYAGTGAVPLASFMLLSGLCDTPTPCVTSVAMSSGDTQTPCAARTCGPVQKLNDSSHAVGLRPGGVFSRACFTSSSVSARWISIGTPCFCARSRAAVSVAWSLV